jgi:hypothetical protein
MPDLEIRSPIAISMGNRCFSRHRAPPRGADRMDRRRHSRQGIR